MKRIFTILILTLLTNISFGQHLYPEKYDECKLSRFCLDCGEPKAQPPQNFVKEIIDNFNPKFLEKTTGQIEVQILVDSIGKPCLLSAKNETNIKLKKINLQKAINNTSNWKPAISEGKPKNSSVSLLFVFENQKVNVRRRNFDFSNRTNMKSVGSPDTKGSKESKLSDTWTVLTQQNSDLPWDMTRAISNDLDDNIWIGTDNGIVKVENEKWNVFTTQNSDIKPTMYDKNQTQGVREMAVDKSNNKWFVSGWDVYKYDNKNWTVYDSINSPINWARKIFVDNSNNVWFTSWRGVAKFDGKNWSVIDTSNSELPSNKVLGIYVDDKNRIWIGTFDGNIRIENGKTTKFENSNSPLASASIAQMYKDKKGNLWFNLYNDDDKSKAGMFVLRTNGEWESIRPKNSKLFTQNSINDFLLDEEKNILWIALNSVGLIKYDLTNDKWETYTTENSNIPSIHIMDLTKDKNGLIWGATFAGIIKQVK